MEHKDIRTLGDAEKFVEYCLNAAKLFGQMPDTHKGVADLVNTFLCSNERYALFFYDLLNEETGEYEINELVSDKCCICEQSLRGIGDFVSMKREDGKLLCTCPRCDAFADTYVKSMLENEHGT